MPLYSYLHIQMHSATHVAIPVPFIHGCMCLTYRNWFIKYVLSIRYHPLHLPLMSAKCSSTYHHTEHLGKNSSYSYTPESSTWDLNISDFTFTWHQGLPTRRSRVSLRKLFGFKFCLHWRICSIPIEGFVADISLIAALNGYATEVLSWDYALVN